LIGFAGTAVNLAIIRVCICGDLTGRTRRWVGNRNNKSWNDEALRVSDGEGSVFQLIRGCRRDGTCEEGEAHQEGEEDVAGGNELHGNFTKCTSASLIFICLDPDLFGCLGDGSVVCGSRCVDFACSGEIEVL